MRELVRRTVRVLAVLVLAAASCYLVVEWKGNEDNRRLYEDMRTDRGGGENRDRPGQRYDLEALAARNPDCVGVVEIPGTAIVYPVVYTDREDGLYYLKRNFDREKDARGSIFLDFRCDPEKPSTNLILYGHRMRSGQMFGQLKEYRSEAFLRSHPLVYYTDTAGTRAYRIFAVVLSEDPSRMDMETRKYQLEFVDAEDQEDMRGFGAFMVKRSLHRPDDAAGELLAKETEFLTLRTCDYAVENGRISVVAVRSEKDE